MVAVQCVFGGEWGMAETLAGPGAARFGESEKGGKVDLAYVH